MANRDQTHAQWHPRGAAPSDPEDSAYLRGKGTITPVAVLGTDAPGGGKIRDAIAAVARTR